MSHNRPVGIDQIGEFDTIIDARSPSEFALDHLPGAVNCPSLDDDERRIVGTIYKQQGAFEARRVGGAMVAANLAKHLRERFADMPHTWRPLVYCWRGGLRSGSMVHWFRLVGWDAQQLAGGYKRYRGHVIALIDALSPQLQLRVLCGPTGSAKTRILHALAERGEQVIDLEGLAVHKGSVLGRVPGQPQPSQKRFETLLATQLEGLDLSRPVFIEAESRKIGQISLPTSLLDRLRASPCIELQASPEVRLEFLLRDYAYLGDDPQKLADTLAQLHGLQSNETLARWREWALAHQLPELFSELMSLHYDPMYARSQGGNYLQLKGAARVPVASLLEDRLAEVAALVAAAA